MGSSWLIGCIGRHFPSGAAPDPVRFRESLAGRLADLRGLNGIRHQLASLVSVAVAGTAAGHGGPLAIAQAAAGWGQDVLAAHGCRDADLWDFCGARGRPKRWSRLAVQRLGALIQGRTCGQDLKVGCGPGGRQIQGLAGLTLITSGRREKPARGDQGASVC